MWVEQVRQRIVEGKGRERCGRGRGLEGGGEVRAYGGS